jgi:NAD+ diphosphatase
MSLIDFEIRSPFVAASRGPNQLEEPAWWFLFSQRRLLIDRSHNQWQLPSTRRPELLGLPLGARHYLGILDGVHVYCAEVIEAASLPNEDFEFLDLRQLHERLPQDLFILSWRAIQIVDWDRNHRYCGRCGSLLVAAAQDRCKICESCGLKYFPRISPAMMVLVTRPGEVLLARGKQFPAGMYSALAGFVEPGETLEACVHREVSEEVGLQVANLRYYGSQPWPFPDSLMIAFVADYLAGEIHVDGDEVVEAAWFAIDELPKIPGEMSIAGKLIRHFCHVES